MTLLRIIKEVPHDEGIDPVNVELETRNKRTVGVAQGHKSRAPLQLGAVGLERGPVCVREVTQCGRRANSVPALRPFSCIPPVK